MTLLAELKRRNVIKVAVLYIIASWLVLQVADVLFPALGVPDWGLRFIIGFLILFFPVALIFSWIYEMTPEGLKRERDIDRSQSITPETGQKINALIIVLLVLAIAAVIADRLIPEPGAVPVSQTPATASPGETASRETANAPTPDTQAATTGAVPEKSVAVLPFVNMSNDPENEFFSDGLSEELLNVLASNPDLFVAARTSSFHFKGHTGDIAAIAEKLRVRNVLEGSVRKSGDRVRITAQLIEASNGYHLWSDTFDRNIDDVFAVQDEISLKVAEALEVALLTDGVPSREADKPTENMDAYLAYLRGQQNLNAGGVEGFVNAVTDFERAVEMDPAFAEAHASLGLAWAGQINWGNITYIDASDKIRVAADRALALDNELALAWTADGLAYAYSKARAFRDPRILGSLERARSLDPDNTTILFWYAVALSWVDRERDSIEPLEKGLLRDPLSSTLHSRLAASQMAILDYDAARQSFLRAAELAPSAPRPPDGLAQLERNRGNFDEAVRWQAKVIDLDPDDAVSRSFVTVDYLELGDPERARQWAEKAMAISPDLPLNRSSLALAYWFGGDHERAMAELEEEGAFVPSTVGASGYWMMVMSLNHWLSVGDLEKAEAAARKYTSNDVPLGTAPQPGELPSGISTFTYLETLSLVRARDGDEAADRLTEDWLRWLEAGVEGWNRGLIASTRCNLLASMGELSGAMRACRASLEVSENSSLTLLHVSMMIDPIRDTPEWQAFISEIEQRRAGQLASLRASDDEPVPR